MSTEVATTPGAELGLSQDELNALLDQQNSEIGSDLLQTPILKIGQPLTREVSEGDAEAGEFINTLTGEGIGNKIEFIVSYYQRGRFASDRESGRAYVAFTKEIPSSWEDLVGKEFVGTPFDEYPDAEEKFKERVNKGEIEWGSGPLVSTTHNFTGFAVVSGHDDEPDDLQAVRLSLKRSDVPTVKKWLTMQKTQRGKPFWDKVYSLSTKRNSYDKGAAYNLVVNLGRDSTAEERIEAVALAQAVAAGRVVDNSASESAGDKTVAPSDNGGLGV